MDRRPLTRDQDEKTVESFDIPPDDLAKTLTVAFAETAGGFVRTMLNDEHRWMVADGDDEQVHRIYNAHELPAVINTGMAMLQWLDGWCEAINVELEGSAKRLLWNAQLTARGGVAGGERLWAVQLAHFEPGLPPQPVSKSVANDMGTAVALVVLQHSDVKLKDVHRQLFPAKYIMEALNG